MSTNAIPFPGQRLGNPKNIRRREERQARNTLGQMCQEAMTELTRRRRMTRKDRIVEDVNLGLRRPVHYNGGTYWRLSRAGKRVWQAIDLLKMSKASPQWLKSKQADPMHKFEVGRPVEDLDQTVDSSKDAKLAEKQQGFIGRVISTARRFFNRKAG